MTASHEIAVHNYGSIVATEKHEVSGSTEITIEVTAFGSPARW